MYVSMDLGDYFLPHFREVFNYYLLKYFLMVFLFVFFFWDPEEYFAKSLQLCPTLHDPIDGSPPGYPVPGTLQARTLEWVVISFSNA